MSTAFHEGITARVAWRNPEGVQSHDCRNMVRLFPNKTLTTFPTLHHQGHHRIVYSETFAWINNIPVAHLSSIFRILVVLYK